MAGRIALLCPVRGRPHYLDDFVASIAATAERPERLSLMFYADADDPKLTEYHITEQQLIHRYADSFAIRFLYGDPIGTPRAINAMYEQSDADIFMIANDDLAFVTPGWDRRVDETAAGLPDGIFNIWFDDGVYGEQLSCYPFLGRRWCEALGYVVPVLFEHYVVDHWLHHLGRFVNRNRFLPDVQISHRHNAAAADEPDFAWQKDGKLKRSMDRDNEVFRRSERYLRLDAEVLKKAIADYVPGKD